MVKALVIFLLFFRYVLSFVLSFPARVSRPLNKEGFLFDRSMEMTRFSSLNLATPGQALGFSSLFLCSSSSRSIHTRHSFPLVFTKHSFLHLSFFVLLLLVSGLATPYSWGVWIFGGGRVNGGGEGEGGGGRRWLGWRRFRGGEETGREGGGLFLFPFWGEGGGGWGGGGDWKDLHCDELMEEFNNKSGVSKTKSRFKKKK